MRRKPPWFGLWFPQWSEVIVYITEEDAYIRSRGGRTSCVRMSKSTWVRLCDGRERRGLKPIRRGLERPGQKHYDQAVPKVLGFPLSWDTDAPLTWVEVQGT